MSQFPSSSAPMRRRALLGWLAAFALLAFAPRIALAGNHQHGLAGAVHESCAACVIGQSPALAAAAAPVADAPRLVARAEPDAPVLLFVGSFSFAAPLACGPPA